MAEGGNGFQANLLGNLSRLTASTTLTIQKRILNGPGSIGQTEIAD